MVLQKLLSETAKYYTDHIAVVDGQRKLTYGELAEESGKLARRLQNFGVSKGQRIGIYLEKSVEAIVAVWAILQTGAAYVPFDLTSPAKRLALIAQDCRLSGIVTTSKLWNTLNPLLDVPTSFVVLTESNQISKCGNFVFESSDSATAADPKTSLVSKAESNDIAYILYTSGSTGQPKGVVISHYSALSFVNWATREVGLTSEDRIAGNAPLNFDLSVFDIFASCKAGAALILMPPEIAFFPRNLADRFAAEKITVSYSVPSLLTRMILHGNLERYNWSNLREIIFAGEVFPVGHLMKLREMIPNARYSNWYGPTETNVCAAYALPNSAGEMPLSVPIGTACAGCELLILSDTGEEVIQSGETGELYVSGAGLMDGYWNMPQQTAEVFRFKAHNRNGKWYRTGDLVRQDSDGQLHFVSRRKGGMVKIRGYRVEPGEVESVLYRHPAVAATVVLAVSDKSNHQVLRAVVVTKPGEHLSADDLRSFCIELLPGYMIPISFTFRQSLPYTATGKLDREAIYQKLLNL